VLLTNDDGLRAEGLAALAEVLRGFAEVLVAAPRDESSGAGHAITLHGELRAEAVEFEGASEAYVVDGTPADCAKLAIRALWADEPPAMCFSGINNGPNVGVNVLYSGTVAAAFEAAVNGVPGVAVSRERGGAITFPEAAEVVAPLLREVVRRHAMPASARRDTCDEAIPPWHVLNVNVPNRPAAEIGGVRLARQGVSGFDEWYVEEGAGDASSATRRFRLEGEMRVRDRDGLSDVEALAEGFVSVTPLALDLTSRTLDDPGGLWDWLGHVPARPSPGY